MTIDPTAPPPGAPTREQRVGTCVRELRSRRGLSLRTLAARAGFSPSFVSQVENGQASPSIASLERIAQALGVTLGEFFAQAMPEQAAVVPAARRPELTSSWSRARVEALGPIGGARLLEPVMLTLEPGGRSGGRPAAHAGDEFAIVFAGEVSLTLGETVHRLGRGDAATFPAELPHRWENTGEAPAQIVVVSARPAR